MTAEDRRQQLQDELMAIRIWERTYEDLETCKARAREIQDELERTAR